MIAGELSIVHTTFPSLSVGTIGDVTLYTVFK